MKKSVNEHSSILHEEYEEIVSKLPTRSPIYLPTEKIEIYDKISGVKRVRDIYNHRLDSIYRPRLQELRKKYYGHERCFLIGNGPSLNQTDLSLLKNEVTFAVNSFFLKLNEIDWVPTFYVVEDHLVAEDRKESINKLKGPVKLFPVYLSYCLDESEDTIFFNHRSRKSYPHGFDFSKDASRVTYTGCTVIYTCMQLAFYMGFKSIYLIGVDSNYTIPQDVQQGNNYGVGVLDMKSDDPNHFHPDYFGKGFRWHDPQVHKMVEAYQEAKKVLSTTNQRIYNSTIGGKLEVFERVPFEQVFNSPNSYSEQEYYPKLIIIDSTRIGHKSATGQIKQTFLERWPKNLYNQIWISGKIKSETPHDEHDLHIRSSFGTSLAIESIIEKCLSFNPDVIYFRPVDSELIFNIAFRIMTSINKPIVLHIMDDWPERLKNTNIILYNILNSRLRQFIAKSSSCLCISDAMSAVYEKRYGGSWMPLANGVDTSEFRQKNWADRPRITKENPFIIRYNGGLAEDMNFDSVTDIAIAVSELSRIYPIQFEIYTMDWYQEKAAERFRDLNGVFVSKLIDEKHYKDLLSEADLLIIAYNFDELSLSYTGLSMANKMPECLASGAVVLGYGPPQSATIDYLKKTECAKIIDYRSIKAVRTVIEELINNIEYCGVVSKKAVEYVSKNLSKKQVQNKFKQCIIDVLSFESVEVPVAIGPFERHQIANINELNIVAENLFDASTHSSILDLGSKDGKHLLSLAEKKWNIYAFEPELIEYKKIVGNLQDFSRLGSVSIENKSLTGSLNKDYCFYRSGQPIAEVQLASEVAFESTGIENYFSEKKIDKIDFIRIGYGFDAFSILREFSWSNYNPRVLFIEYANDNLSENEQNFQAIADLLMRFRFLVYISEWYSSVDQNVESWKQLLRYPCKLSERGNLIKIIAFREPADVQGLINGFRNSLGIRNDSTISEDHKGNSELGEYKLISTYCAGNVDCENGSYRLNPSYESNWVGFMFSGLTLPDDRVVSEINFNINDECTLHFTLCRNGNGQFESTREKVTLLKGEHTVKVTHQFKNTQDVIRLQVGVEDKSVELSNIEAILINLTAKERYETLNKSEKEKSELPLAVSDVNPDNDKTEVPKQFYTTFQRFIWRILRIAGMLIKRILRFIIPNQQRRQNISIGIRKKLPTWLNKLLL